ncbi:hypothetical protein [Priestia aryabhattai]|uniref:hypothetical protein n=1 Tax=Priestia aryabhattai TaxID=412384 RepID=UPI002E1B55AD|nr:hypothetical protein [Priestia aryabhattai]
MTIYLKESNFDQSKFYQTPKTMFIDDRIMNDKRGEHNAVLLYMGIMDKVELSKSKYKREKDASFMDLKGKFFCTFPCNTARKELRIKRGKYYQHKALLREAGLIHYEEQKMKQEGEASRIYITSWADWVKQNGLYSDGKWIVQPSSKAFYNPKHIVTVQPTFEEINEVDQEPTEENLKEYESIMSEAKSLGVKFHKFKRIDELNTIVEKHLGVGKRFINSTVEDLSVLRLCYEEMKRNFHYETEMSDF